MKNKLPVTYREQDGCQNCAHVFAYDDGEYLTFYCALGSKIPPRNTDLQWDRFASWRKGRDVLPHGICDSYISQKPREAVPSE